MYFNHMHTYHISYAAYPNDQDSTEDYIRTRRYMPEANGLRGTDLAPDYFRTGLFKTGVPHTITVIKRGQELFMHVRNDEKQMLCHWKNESLPPILEGRIGLRHMFTRSARYRDFRIFAPAADKSDRQPNSPEFGFVPTRPKVWATSATCGTKSVLAAGGITNYRDPRNELTAARSSRVRLSQYLPSRQLIWVSRQLYSWLHCPSLEVQPTQGDFRWSAGCCHLRLIFRQRLRVNTGTSRDRSQQNTS